jgi:hypothetical protein
MWIFAIIPTDPPGRCKIDHHEVLGHSSINRPRVSARQIFAADVAFGVRRRANAGSGELCHWSTKGFETIKPVVPEGTTETYRFEQWCEPLPAL